MTKMGYNTATDYFPLMSVSEDKFKLFEVIPQ